MADEALEALVRGVEVLVEGLLGGDDLRQPVAARLAHPADVLVRVAREDDAELDRGARTGRRSASSVASPSPRTVSPSTSRGWPQTR